MLLLHQGGFQNPPPFSQGGFTNVNACENFSGPDLVDIVNRLDDEIDVVVSAHTHAPYICTINNRLVTSAASFGRLITEIELTIDSRTNDVVSATREQPHRHADGREGRRHDRAAGAVQDARRIRSRTA